MDARCGWDVGSCMGTRCGWDVGSCPELHTVSPRPLELCCKPGIASNCPAAL